MRFYPFVFIGTDEGGIAAYYNYSADGERNIKLTSPRLNIQQNASLFNNPPLVYPTLYASPLITLTAKGYTNVTEVERRASLLAFPRCSNVTERTHYFEEGRRICSKIGGGMRGNVTVEEIDSRVGEMASSYEKQYHTQNDGIRQTFHDCIKADPQIIDGVNLHKMLIEREIQRNEDEPAFFYHSDHLGSAAYLTSGGHVTQTLNYLPYGEDWVEYNFFHPNDTTRLGIYRFNGKEKDYESGFHYYGARYYWSEVLTGWLSVDPMADKYPSISPYAYCAWNPVKLVDPDGREIWIGIGRSCSKYIPKKEGNVGVAKALDMIYESKAGAFVINSLIKSKNKYFVFGSANPSGEGNPGYVDADNQVYLNVNKHGLNPLTLSHELFHAFQDENGVHGKLRSKEVEAFVFAGIVLSQLNKGRDVSSLTKAMSSGMRNAYNPSNSFSKEGIKYQSAMISLTKGFSTAQMGIAVSRFLNFSIEGEGYRNERGYKYCDGDGARYRPHTSLLNKYSKDLY